MSIYNLPHVMEDIVAKTIFDSVSCNTFRAWAITNSDFFFLGNETGTGTVPGHNSLLGMFFFFYSVSYPFFLFSFFSFLVVVFIF